ncbi:hypothetical protein GGR57DRAFT_294314 [Xylariaceae sp. FL1272]|nr:hypothetical protein GGR57DRAFT_294314 [Xylariaceae sp. FL1272]
MASLPRFWISSSDIFPSYILCLHISIPYTLQPIVTLQIIDFTSFWRLVTFHLHQQQQPTSKSSSKASKMSDQSNRISFRGLLQAATADPANRNFSRMPHITGPPRADRPQPAVMRAESVARHTAKLSRHGSASSLEVPFPPTHRITRDSLEIHARHCRRLAPKPKLLQRVKDKFIKLHSKVHGAPKALTDSTSASATTSNVPSVSTPGSTTSVQAPSPSLADTATLVNPDVSSTLRVDEVVRDDAGLPKHSCESEDFCCSQSEYSNICDSEEDEDPVDYSWLPRGWNQDFDLYRDETPDERFHRRLAMAKVHIKAKFGL